MAGSRCSPRSTTASSTAFRGVVSEILDLTRAAASEVVALDAANSVLPRPGATGGCRGQRRDDALPHPAACRPDGAAATGGAAEKPTGYFWHPAANAPISQRRRVSAPASHARERRRSKDAYGVTVNDVVLAIVAGALRSYLDRTGNCRIDRWWPRFRVSTRTDASGSA